MENIKIISNNTITAFHNIAEMHNMSCSSSFFDICKDNENNYYCTGYVNFKLKDNSNENNLIVNLNSIFKPNNKDNTTIKLSDLINIEVRTNIMSPINFNKFYDNVNKYKDFIDEITDTINKIIIK